MGQKKWKHVLFWLVDQISLLPVLVADLLLHLITLLHPSFISVARLRSRTWRQLHVLGAGGAGGAGGSGDPGEGLLVRWGQVDHEEDAIRHVLLGAAAGEPVLPPAASDGGKQLAVPLRVLQVLQSDHVGQVQLTIQTDGASAPAYQKAEDTEEEEEEGGGCYGNIGDGAHADDGLTWTLTLRDTKTSRHTSTLSRMTLCFCFLVEKNKNKDNISKI